MTFFEKLTQFALYVIAGLGTTAQALETVAQRYLDAAGGDVKEAGDQWLAWFVKTYQEKFGDFDSAKAFGQQLWASATGHRPAFNANHFFNI